MVNARMPVLFVGHGSPMNAIENNEFSQSWVSIAAGLPQPRAILCISAHWETIGTSVTAMAKPRTIHDFYGFPPQLSNLQYPAPGSPSLANEIKEMVKEFDINLDQEWGLDHGTWSVLVQMFPKAEIPVIQLSLDLTQDPQFFYDLGSQLRVLRREGVLIVGSGNIVHKLGLVVWEDIAFDWAEQFDSKVKECILQNDHQPLIHYEKLGKPALLSINTAEHYEPLLVTLGIKEPDEPVQFFNEKIWGGSLSMRSLLIG
jgi:4,5-DOPA dioxygenase extradiol